MRATRVAALALIAWLAATPGAARAQRGGNGFRGAFGGVEPTVKNIPYDGRFTFVRLRYTGLPGNFYYRDEPSWAHGYNDAEHNLLSITNEVTALHAHLDGTNAIAIDDPLLFRYPVAYMTESGYWDLTGKETVAMRSYLLKGGFLILDDTRDGRSQGNMGYANIEANFQRILPGLHFIDLQPSHPIFHAFFDINSFDIVRQYYDRGRPVFRALFEDNDPKKRMLVLLNFNTDVSNYWEFSATGFRPIDDSNEAYKLGVNYLIYALTH
jgi:hypothetical protein